MHNNAEPVRVPVEKVKLPDTQFKEGADPKTGVVEGQQLQGEYYESAENAVAIYERENGDLELVTGRHRFDLAKRKGKTDILARVFREKDGYTPSDMRNLDAISNIIDEKGSVKDYVKYFDNAKPSRAAAEAGGFLSRTKGRLAFELYEGATEDTRASVDWSGSGADGLISTEQAGIIASAAPQNANPRFAAVQKILVGKALNGLRGKKLGILARSLAEEAKNRKETPKVGGEMQLDLFTSEEDQALLAMEDRRADYRVRKAGEYGRVAEVLRTAISKGGKLELNEEYAKELGITDPKDRQQLIAARDKAVERANYWENAIVLDPSDRAAMDDEINAKSSREAAKRAEIQKKSDAKLAEIKEKRTGKKTPEKVVQQDGGDLEKSKAAAEKYTLKDNNGIVHKLTEMVSTGFATFYPSRGLYSDDSGKPHVVTIGFDNISVSKDSVPYFQHIQDEYDKKHGGSEKTQSVPEKPKSVIKNGENVPAEPKTKMKNADEEAKVQKMEDDLAALFDDHSFNPDQKKPKVRRPFDVLTPDGKKVTIHEYTMNQAIGYANTHIARGSVVYEQGGLEDAIIRERERRARERVGSLHEQYPVGAGILGPGFDRAVKATVDGGSARQVSSLLGQANQGRSQ